MADYVLYCLEGSSLVRCERFEADSDDAAITESSRRQKGHAAELWCDSRRVKAFTAARAD